MNNFPDAQNENINNLEEKKQEESVASQSSNDLFSILPQEEKETEKNIQESVKDLPEEKVPLMTPFPTLPQEEKREEENISFPGETKEEEKNMTAILPGTEEEQKEEEKKEVVEKPLEELLPESAVEGKKERKKNISLTHLTGKTLGQLLAEARKEQGMTIEEVTQITLIRADYIKGLEEDDHKKLPPIIFVKAYVRALRDLYGLDEASCAMLQDHLSDLEDPADVPEKVVDELNKNVQINEEEARKVQLTGYYLLGALALLLIFLFSLVIYFAAVRGKNVQTQKTVEKTEVIQPAAIDSLIPQIIPEEQLMPLPGKKRRSR